MPETSKTESLQEPQNTAKIATNTAWSGVEAFSALLATVLSSVLVARVIGKNPAGQARLGSYQYIVWLTTITLTMGSFGVNAATRKYMAEYLNKGQADVARAIYLSTLKIQSYITIATAAIGFAVILLLGGRQYVVASLLLVLAVIPRLIGFVPSQANNAAEVARRNTGPAVIGVAITTVVTMASLAFGWEFVGLSAAVLLGAAVECAGKLQGVERWMQDIPKGVLPSDLRKRMFTYSGQSVGLMLLNLLVWDRSDIMILKALNPDTRQITFFSLSFSITDRLLVLPTLFSGALGFTMMAQYGRGESRLKRMTADGSRYTLLLALPFLLGMACVSRPLVLLVFGEQYRPMIPTMALIALLAIPKALIAAPTILLQATERQAFLLYWGCICGVVDIGLDILLVGGHGAVGAAIANGAAQTMAAVGIWVYVCRKDRLDLKLGNCARILLSGAIMSAGVLATVHFTPGRISLPLGVIAGVFLWLVALRVTAVLDEDSVSRLLGVGRQIPVFFQPSWKHLIAWLAPTRAKGL